MALTGWLAWLGHKKTTDIRSFAVGRGDMSPWVVGVTLAASLASTATFVINPGFVYVHGISAIMHLGVAAGLGVIAGLVLLSPGFRRVGEKVQAITLPQWVGQRYGSRALTVLFAVINLLSLSFVVLIVGGLSIVMQQTIGLTNVESLVLVIGFVFSYIFVGGTYAHAYTNTLQGFLMVLTSIAIIISGLGLLGGDAETKLLAQDPNLLELINPRSSLFGSFFAVYVSGFVIGFALVCQPHVLTKALYVKTGREVAQFLAVTIVVSLVFSGLLLVGLYAHLAPIPVEKLVDSTTGVFRQDLVMTAYIDHAFGPTAVALVTVALLAAGMSTLDGILVALSSIVANDLFLNLAADGPLKNRTPEQRSHIAHHASQLVLVFMGIAAFLLALNPPKLLGIFGQVGVYGIVAASVAPILFGIITNRAERRGMMLASLAGLGIHFTLYLWGQWAVSNQVDLVEVANNLGPLAVLFDTKTVQLGFMNPGVTATYGIVISLLLGATTLLFAPKQYVS
ncbi:MAG: hypothetical protein HUU55_18855 [Myxococcales bacterium]|nr:hypothetical protein [Myxococcales bacterium]